MDHAGFESQAKEFVLYSKSNRGFLIRGVMLFVIINKVTMTGLDRSKAGGRETS